jgi:hypothetical protein
LSEGAHINCPRCGGSGHIRDTESSALQILRIIQEESMKDNTAAVHCQVPVEVASFLLNEKRSEITKIELKQRVNVIMVPNKSMDTPHYKLERLKHDDSRLESMEASYKLADEPEEVTTVTRRSQEPTNKQTPVIKGCCPMLPRRLPSLAHRASRCAAAATPAPVAARLVVREQGFFAWLKNLFGFGAPAPVAAPAPAAEAPLLPPVKAAATAAEAKAVAVTATAVAVTATSAATATARSAMAANARTATTAAMPRAVMSSNATSVPSSNSARTAPSAATAAVANATSAATTASPRWQKPR